MAEPQVTPQLTGILGRPFDRQVEALRLRARNLVPTARWDDLWQENHDRAFVVAGAMKADLLADLSRAVEDAVSGGSLEAFRRDFRAIVAKRGWHGWTGEGTAAGEAWRTRVIYQTNMRTSYAAGRMAQLIEGDFPLWVYRHGGSREPRPEHLAWDGLTLPPDHPFWTTHAPPNGWGCSCYILGASSPARARGLGGDPDKGLPPGWDATDAKTGAPKGIDRGWAYAPGRSVAEAVNIAAAKLSTFPSELAVDLMQSWLSSSVFARWMTAPEEGTAFPLARVPDADAARIGARTPVAMLSSETMAKQRRVHAELTAVDYAEAQNVVANATHKIQDGPHALIYVRAPSDANGHVLVVKATQTGLGLFVTSFRRLSMNAARRDRTLRQLLRKGK